ncbi:Heme NO binding protein [Roseovarius albus]|uniref:Heme NO binding protein n=1 Tax=Roseovarius albus TaxID=1247867 RepID=A0A1X6YIA0_9RHOB|nr:heme NO-binding domain-containing protein [Roseovarius albus]SLN22398.1 Heme NO binding protein [Roseovarius albus]
MHGLINQSIQGFVCDTYGHTVWEGVMRQIDPGFAEFEAMLTYEDDVTIAVIDAVSNALDKSPDDVLEDVGTYLISHSKVRAVRRLLRFGGVDFEDFLHSLDDLPARAKLAVPDLILPRLELRDHAPQAFSLMVYPLPRVAVAFGHVVLGALRAMADDYGALVFLDHRGQSGEAEMIDITLLEAAFAEGKSFELGVRASS